MRVAMFPAYKEMNITYRIYNYHFSIINGSFIINAEIIYKDFENRAGEYMITLSTEFSKIARYISFNMTENERIINGSYYVYNFSGDYSCLIGEFFAVNFSGKCLPCLYGSYSLGINASDCLPCPDNSVCYGNIIIVNAGFWRSSINSTLIHSCRPNPDLCL